MRLTTSSCRLGGTISARMKRWPLSGSTVGCVIGLPAFADAPVWCRKRSRWSTPPLHCLPPTTSMEQQQNSPCHCVFNTLLHFIVLSESRLRRRCPSHIWAKSGTLTSLLSEHRQGDDFLGGDGDETFLGGGGNDSF